MLLRYSTWRTVRSRKERSFRTSIADFGHVHPMLVPSPPAAGSRQAAQHSTARKLCQKRTYYAHIHMYTYHVCTHDVSYDKYDKYTQGQAASKKGRLFQTKTDQDRPRQNTARTRGNVTVLEVLPPEVIFHSRVIGAYPVTTDCIVAMR